MNAAAVRREIEWLIDQFGVTAELRRPTSASDGFFGSHESAETSRGNIKAELVAATDPTGSGGKAHVKVASAVLQNDFLVVSGVRYRVKFVETKAFFGDATHLELLLEKENLHG